MTGYERIRSLLKSENPEDEELTRALVETLLETRLDRLIRLDENVDLQRVADRILEEFHSLSGPSELADFSEAPPEEEQAPLDRILEQELNDLLPEGVQGFLRDIVTRDYRANPELVRSLVEHPAMRTVLRNVLEETLSEFVHRLSVWIRESDRLPGMGGVWSFFTGFFGYARRYTRRYASRLEDRVQEQVDRFVDEMIEEVINKLVEELSSEQLQGDLAEWRGAILDVLMDRSLDSYLVQESGEAAKEKELKALFEEVVQSDQFRSSLEQSLGVLLRSVQKQTLQDLLRWVGYEKNIRAAGKKLLKGFLS
jgi:hypothetical protein